MKISTLVLILYYSVLISDAQGVWTVQNPLPTCESLTDVYCLPNTTNAWAVGGYGVILKTVDGNSWSTLNSGTTNYLSGVQFINTNTGWVVGSNGTILKTTNGGSSWTAQSSGTSIDLEKVHFINSNAGWVVGDQWQTNTSVILKTVDGGTTWTLQTFTDVDFYDIFFSDSNNGWAVGRLGVIWKSSDGGSSWTTLTSGVTSHLQTVHFISSSVGWACGLNGTIIKTTNGGTTWTKQTPGVVANLYGSCFVNSSTGWVVGGGYIQKTSDGGTNWVVQSNYSNESTTSVYCANTSSAWVVGSKIYRTTNGGSGWNCLSTGVPVTLNRVKFINANKGWAVGMFGTILNTMDGGLTWASQTSPTTSELRDVYFYNENIGWAVGFDGIIIKTADGGSSWVAQASGTTSRLHGVFFISTTTGWAVGYNSTTSQGTILKTTNGGSTWSAQTVGTNVFLTYVRFFDLNNGLAVTGFGSTSTLLKTTDGGSTWNAQTLSFTTSGAFFVNSTTGWAYYTFENGYIRKTSDGGATWTIQLNYPQQIFNVFFYNTTTGWAVGRETILKTTDGGTTWISEACNTSKVLTGVHFVEPNTGWVAGTQGVILHYTNFSPTTQASNIINSNPTYQSINVAWTRGNGNQNALFVKQGNTGNCVPDVNVTYLPNSAFGLGDQVGSTGWYCLYNGSGTSVSVSGLQANTSYRFHVCEYNFSPDFTHYNTTTATNNPLTATTAIAPPQITVDPNPVTLCESLSTSFSVTASGTGLGYQWKENSGANITNGTVYSGATTSTLTLTVVPANLNGIKYYCVVSNTSGSATSGEALLTVNPLPVAPGEITGDQIVCRNTSYTYLVPIIQNATSYEWTFPTGFSGSSTTNSINLTTSSNSVAGIISVKGSNSCGSGPLKNFNVSVKNLPANAAPITGSDEVCTRSINIGYNTSLIADADYYIWSLPLGATGASSTNSIMVSYGATPLSDQITVKGHNMCGDGVPSVLPVTVSNVPSLSGSITGLSNVCKNQTDVLYSINDSPDATSYLWTLPPGVTGSNSTDSVYLRFGPDAFSGDLKVSGVNSCGTGPYITFPVVIDEVPEPAGLISGLDIVCRGQSNVLYTINPSARATYYVWDLPDGSSETTVTNKIVINFNNNVSSGSLYVTPFNSCGAGNGSSLFIEIPTPLKPAIDDSEYKIGMCFGENPIKLSVKNAVEGYAYQWYRNGAPIGSSTFIEDFFEDGSYYVEADLNGCKNASDSLNMDFKEALGKPDIIARGPTVWYLSTNASAKYYKWYHNSEPIPGAGKNTYIAGQILGTYRVSISDDNECYSISDAMTIPKGITGIKDIDPFEGVKIYPNPTTGIFTIEMDNNIFGELFIDIFTPNGSKALNIKFEKTTEHFSSEIDLSGQSKGMYIINLSIEKYTATRKILIK